MSMRSVALSGLEDRVKIVCSDIRMYNGESVDVVVANPPYRPAWTGRVNPDPVKALARHEISLDLDTLLGNSCMLLRPGGRIYLVYPAWRLADLITTMRTHRIEPKTMIFVHSASGTGAEMCLVCGMKDGGKELNILSPFTVFAQQGVYTEEMEAVFRELRLPKSH